MTKAINRSKNLGFREREDLLWQVDLTKENKRKVTKRMAHFRKEATALNTQVEELSSIFAYKGNINIFAPKTSVSTSETTACILTSDWHVDNTTTRAQILGGINEHNVAISRARTKECITKAASLIEYQRAAGTKVDTLVFWAGGDYVNGIIHEEFHYTNELTPIDAASEAEDQLIWSLEFLLANGGFKKIIVPCSVGNHGRITEKKLLAIAPGTNIEMSIYLHLQKYFRKDPRIEFILPVGLFTQVEVYGREIMFSHGDQLPYGGGIGGISIPMAKRIPVWNSMCKAQKGLNGKPKNPYLYCIGHFHTFTPGRQAIVNGCLVGYDSYAQENALSPEPPSQTLFYMDKNYGLTDIEPLWVS